MSFMSGSTHEGLYEHSGTDFIVGLTSEMYMVSFLSYTICSMLWTIMLLFWLFDRYEESKSVILAKDSV